MEKSLADSGLQELEPVEIGSWFVDISTIEDEELLIILEYEFEDMDLSDIEDCVSPLAGGIVAKQNGNVIIHPTCCVDLTNLYEWMEIKDVKYNQWTMLWIGHSWVFYKRTAKCVIFSDYSDNDLEDFEKSGKEPDIKYMFDEKELMAELGNCYQEQNNFQVRCARIYKELGVEPYEELATKVAGL